VEDVLDGSLLILEELSQGAGLLLQVALSPFEDLPLFGQDLLERFELIRQLGFQDRADALEVALLSCDVLAQGLDSGLEQFQRLVHISTLFPEVPLQGTQPFLEQALGLLDRPDLFVEFALDAFQRRGGSPRERLGTPLGGGQRLGLALLDVLEEGLSLPGTARPPREE
jgi:hypothetical protein